MTPLHQHAAFVSDPGNPFIITSLGGTSTGAVHPQFVAQAQVQQRSQTEPLTRTWHDSVTPTPSLVIGQNSPPPQTFSPVQTLKSTSPVSPPQQGVTVDSEMPADETLQGESCVLQKEAPEVKMIVGTRVRAIEKLQFKIGARVVIVQPNAQGTVVQLYPNIGIDWDCLPSVDKVFVQPDTIEPLPQLDSCQSQQKQTVYMEAYKREADTALPPATRLPQVAPVIPQMAATLPPMPSGNPSAGLASLLGKSTSSPALITPPVSKHLPRLDSPTKMPRLESPHLRGKAHSADTKLQSTSTLDSLPAGSVFTGGSGPRPLSMSSNALYFKQQPQHSPRPPMDEMARSTGQLRTLKPSIRTESPPPPKFFVQGEKQNSSVAIH